MWCDVEQSSVPHLKTRLQLQQAIMKELIQRTITDKKGATVSSSSSTAASATQSTVTTTSVSAGSATVFSLAQDSTSSLTSGAQSSSSSSIPQVVSSTSASPSSSGTSLVKVTRGPASSVGGQNIAKPVVIGASVVSIGKTGPTPILQRPGGGSGTPVQLPENVSVQFPKGIHEHIAKLPAEQQLMYIQRILKNPQLMQQHQKNVREKHMKLAQEQQVPLMMGVSKSTPAVTVSRGNAASAAVKVGAGNSVGVARSASSISVGGSRVTGVADLKGKGGGKVVSTGISSPGSVGSTKKKGKGKESLVDAE